MSTRTFPVSGPISLTCRFGFGSLDVTADDEASQAQVTLKARDQESDVLSRTTVEMRGSVLTVQGPKPRGGVFDLPVFNSRARIVDAMDIEIVIPAGSGLKVSTFSADVTTHGRVGTSDLASGSTTMELEHVDGDARIRFGTGPLHIATITGSASVRAGSSDVTIGDGGGDLDVAFGTGSLEVATAHACA